MRPLPTFLSTKCFVLSLLIFAIHIRALDVYFDAYSNSSYPNGTKENPFKHLQQAIDILTLASSKPYPGMSLNLYFKPHIAPYTGVHSILYLNNADTNSFTISSWTEVNPVHSIEDCLRLPTIDVAFLGFSFEQVPDISVSGVNLINLKGGITISRGDKVRLSNMCLDDSTSNAFYFIQIVDTQSLIIRNVVSILSGGREIVVFKNIMPGGSYNVQIENLDMIYLNTSNETYEVIVPMPYFAFTLETSQDIAFDQTSQLTIKGLKLQGTQVEQTIPLSVFIGGWNTVTISGVSIEKQSVTFTDYGVLQIQSASFLDIQDMVFSSNVIFTNLTNTSQQQVLFISCENVENLFMMEIIFDNNIIYNNGSSSVPFKMLSMQTFSNFDLLNIDVSSNIFMGESYIIVFTTKTTDSSSTMYIENVTLMNNCNPDTQVFYFLMFSQSGLEAFSLENLQFINNSLTGRLFHLEAVPNIAVDDSDQPEIALTPTYLNLTNMATINNTNIIGFELLFFSIINSPYIQPDFVSPAEYYSIAIRNLTVTNNNFSKGTISDWLDQVSLFQVAGSQVYIENSLIENNTFAYYDFVSLDQQVSSVFFVNSVVQNNTIQNGNFIITEYENIRITRGPFCTGPGVVEAFYRYAFVLNSTFSNMILVNSSFFILNNAFLIFTNNLFETFSFDNSLLIAGGKFTPPSLDTNAFSIERFTQLEAASLMADPYLYDMYLSTVNNLIALNPPVIYFYVIAYNVFADFTISSQNIISFEDYNFQQSIISIKHNKINGFTFVGNPTNVIQFIDSNTFRFYNNSVSRLTGVGSLLSFSLLQDNRRFFLTDNLLEWFNGPSFLIASGSSISTMNLTRNMIRNNLFSSSVIGVDIVLNVGDIEWFNNTFVNNTLMADNEGLYSKIAFISLSAQAAKHGQNLVFDGWNFTGNSYENLQSFSQYGQLNAFFSLLLANSTVIFRNSVFNNMNLDSKGISMFYFASIHTTVENCIFSGNTVFEGISMMKFMSLRVNLLNNTFNNNIIFNGKGIIYLSTLPFLRDSLSLEMKGNKFINCLAGFGNVLAIENTNFNLMALDNIFVDSFQNNAALSFGSSYCSHCLIENSTFIITPAGVGQNMFYQFTKFQGNFMILNSYVQYSRVDMDIDLFVGCTNSLQANLTISNLVWSKEWNRSPLQIANIDSGNLTIVDTELTGFTYNMKKAAGYVVQVNGGPFNVISAAVNLKNVTLKNMTFKRLLVNEKFKAGAISFLSSNQVMSYFWKLNIWDCVFDTLINASAIYVQMPALYIIKIMNSQFIKAVNEYAPALNYFTYSNSKSRIYISNSTFINNSAVCGGGAISLTGLNYSIINNVFTGNTAGSLGGAILLEYAIKNPNSFVNNIFNNNYAPVGPDIGSTISNFNLDLILPKESEMYIDYDLTGNGYRALTIKNASSTYIPAISLNVTFVDRDGSPTIDFGTNQPYLILSFANQSTLTSFNCTSLSCYIDRFNTSVTGLAYDVIPVQVSYFSAFGTTLLRNFNIQLRPCINGEYNNTHTRTCDYCKNGSYSLSPTDTCQDCPTTYAFCPGGSTLISKSGYWRANSATSVFYECRDDGIQRCIGGVSNNGCLPGYTGPLCEACDFDNGYVESGILHCSQCQNVWVSVALNIGATILYLLYKIFCIGRMYFSNECFCSNNEDNYTTFKASESGYYVKLLLVYTQVISVVYLFNADLRQYLGSIFQVGNPSQFILVGLECSLTAMGVSPDKFIYVSTVYLMVSPFVQCIIIMILATIFARKLMPSIKISQFVRLTVIYMILLEQPGLIGFFTSFLSCSTIYEASSVEYIALHPNWTCNDPLYDIYKYFVVIPGAVFWAIFLPVYLFSILYVKRKSLNDLNVRMTLGALYNLNKPNYYYWGTVVMVLELILSYTAYGFQNELKARVFTLFILLWSYQFAVRQLKPYRFSRFNSMESLTFSLLMLNIILGYYTVDNNNEFLTYAAYVVMAVLNLAMVLFLAWKMFDMTVMRIFDLFLDKIRYYMRRRRMQQEDKSPTRDRLVTAESTLSNDKELEITRTERAETQDNLNQLMHRPSFEPGRPDESFVM